MPISWSCPECGVELPTHATEHQCPRGGPEALAMTGPPVTEALPGSVQPDLSSVARHLPQFEILGVLGQGGMGVVYKARQRKLDRLVAVKVLPPQVDGTPAFMERFTREARALARLEHPGIVAVYDFGESDGLCYLVMPLVDGTNLRQQLQSGRPSTAEVLHIIAQLCDALQYAHERGVIHRDIKPENILLDQQGHIKIADFGLAKVLGNPSGHPGLTGTAQIMGTPAYMAPEQIETPLRVDQRADIYALGVVFYEMLTGERPLGRFALPSEKVGVDRRLDSILLRALARDPEQRYQRASELKAAVEELAATSIPARDRPWCDPTPAQTTVLDATRHIGWGRWKQLLRSPKGLPPGLWWKTLALAAILYGVSFLLPAYRYYASWDHGPGDHGYIRANGVIHGWACYNDAWTFQYTCWYANPALWVGALLLLVRRWWWAGMAGLVAVGLALSIWDPFSQSTYYIGYYLWLASMLVLTGGSLYAWWKLRPRRGPNQEAA